MENAIALVITMLVLVIVGIPLLRERKPEEDFVDEEYEDSELDRLVSQKDTAVEAIRELEFDHAVGSLSDEDYADLKEKYEKKAITLLKNLKEAGEPGVSSRDQDEGRRIVKATPTKRGEKRRAREFDCPECGAPYEEGDLFCAACGVELGIYEDCEDSDLACPECGEPYEEEDVYCASCGAELGMGEEELATDLATDEEYIADDHAEEQVEKPAQPVNPTSDNKPKRQTRRVSNSKKKTASNNGKGLGRIAK